MSDETVAFDRAAIDICQRKVGEDVADFYDPFGIELLDQLTSLIDIDLKLGRVPGPDPFLVQRIQKRVQCFAHR